MAKGRGNAHAAAILLLIIGLQSCSLWHPASATTHTVGGSKGWDLGVDYTTWAAGQTFKVGDVLFFPYAQGEHDVVVINKADYDACSETNAVATYSDGNSNVTISTTGTHYYLCSVISHCAAGMKLAVTVTAAAPVPTASPPSSSPIIAPSTAPSSKSTPASAPSPSPSPSSPAPTPTPSSSSPVPSVGPPASSPGAPGSTPSSAGTPRSSPPSPNAASSLLASAVVTPLVVLWAAALFVYY